MLVLLIEFNDEELIADNPQTTGNGKFMQDPTDYEIILGSPPHDYEFFELHLEALKHYYNAASYYHSDVFSEYGFDLDYDVYPLPGLEGEFLAYTLPNSMAYYNPPGVDYATMVSRFEEYFQDCFISADQDDDINFSLYDHFMLIHAGSDWQHDVAGDTPSDMPSFFINIGEGKEVYVDDGIKIDHACNVPETISQDFQYYTDNGLTTVDGYGLINAVMAHEFGHSLGFVDLYNTFNFYPAVGYFDIMDSGGLGRLSFPVNDQGEIDYDDYNYIFDLEGCLPILPGAWSRLIPWENDFQQRGIIKDYTEIEFDAKIHLNPAGSKPHNFPDNAYIVKLRLNDHEYLLIENRQVDPDGDGGTAVQSSADQRVILYPTPISDNNPDSISYEYDYLLPGWFTPQGEALGGGLLIWHIDENILAENDNFANNTVNQSRNRRAVKIIEADNIDDIGNPYTPSWSWRGTEYDPFYKFAPLLNDLGYFLGWDIQYSGSGEVATHNDSLASTTLPPLQTNDGNPSFFTVYQISSYSVQPDLPRIMSFKIGSSFFTETDIITTWDTGKTISLLGNSYTFPTVLSLSNNGVDFYNLIGNEWFENSFGQNLIEDFNPVFPIITLDYLADTQSEIDEYLIVEDSSLNFITPVNEPAASVITINFPSSLTDAPVFIPELALLVVTTEDKLYLNGDSLDIPDAKISFNGSEIMAFTGNRCYYINPSNTDDIWQIPIPHIDRRYDPVCFLDSLNSFNNMVYFFTDTQEIWRIHNYQTDLIFRLYPYTDNLPTQLALGNFIDQDMIHLTFAAGDRVFAISPDGSLARHFPAFLEGRECLAFSYPKILRMNEDSVILIEEDQGYWAVDQNANPRPEYSFFWNKTGSPDTFFWDEHEQKLRFVYLDGGNSLLASSLPGFEQDPVIWSGFRNNDYTCYQGAIPAEIIPQEDLQAFAYPNPAAGGEVRIRVENAVTSIKLKIFDIAGNLIFQTEKAREEQLYQDLTWDTRKIASGIYFGLVYSGSSQVRVPIAVKN
ncbi:MAG: T9SS type A sorting domain-containing protein [Candidatus Cloacimonetes bacterium]|nr:T9SS type A sorting domain-containing protein [Candidatus Cloacimonadota bacterium]